MLSATLESEPPPLDDSPIDFSTVAAPEDLIIVPDDGQPYEHFGYASAAFGDYAIVGAPFDDAGSGAAYIFNVRTGELVHELHPEATATGARYGFSVSISEQYALVGAPNGGAGHVYVYDVDTGELLRALTPNDGDMLDFFGQSVAISGDFAIVGAVGDDDVASWSGAAYVFDVTTGEQLHKFTISDSAPGAAYGFSVAIDGDVALLGGNSGNGVHVFDLQTGEHLRELTVEGLPDRTFFGSAVAMSDGMAVIGAFGSDQMQGAAYVFDVSTGEMLYKLTAEDGAAGDQFGQSVAIDGGFVVVGAYSFDSETDVNIGAAYLYDLETGELFHKLLAEDGEAYDQFGRSVAISDGQIVVVGADGDELQTGAAYIYHYDVNELPEALPDAYTVEQGQELVITAPGVLANDVDADGDPLTVVIVQTTEHGTLVLSEDGSFVYTPDEGFVGVDTFQYTASDGTDVSELATVVIDVLPPPPPGAISGTVWNDRDGDGEIGAHEPGLGGRIVYVDANDNGLFDDGEIFAETTGHGLFEIAGLAPGVYTVRQVVHGNWSLGDASEGYSVEVVSGATTTDVDFGNTTGHHSLLWWLRHLVRRVISHVAEHVNEATPSPQESLASLGRHCSTTILAFRMNTLRHACGSVHTAAVHAAPETAASDTDATPGEHDRPSLRREILASAIESFRSRLMHAARSTPRMAGAPTVLGHVLAGRMEGPRVLRAMTGGDHVDRAWNNAPRSCVQAAMTTRAHESTSVTSESFAESDSTPRVFHGAVAVVQSLAMDDSPWEAADDDPSGEFEESLSAAI